MRMKEGMHLQTCGRPCQTCGTLVLHCGSKKRFLTESMQAPQDVFGNIVMSEPYIVSKQVMHGHTWKARKAAKRPRTDAGTVLPCTAVPMESAAQHTGSSSTPSMIGYVSSARPVALLQHAAGGHNRASFGKSMH